MNHDARNRVLRWSGLMMIAVLLAGTAQAEPSPTAHPLEPPDRSSPRATLTTFLESLDRAWVLYSASDPGFLEPLRDATECLDLSHVPPLVLDEVSAQTALVLKEVLDRLELPPMDAVPDAAAVEELGLVRWTIPHTELQLVEVAEGDRQGRWIFSSTTVQRAEEFYDRVRHLPYRPGRSGGHIESLRAGSRAVWLLKLNDVMPSWFQHEIGGMMAWQWLGLGIVVVVLALAVAAVGWFGTRWRRSSLPGRRLASYLFPAAMMCVPIAGRLLIARLFTLPGVAALTVRLLFSIVGFVGLAWVLAQVVTHLGDLTIGIGFRNARPLKKQLVRAVFRVATIVVVVGVSLKELQALGVPVAGLIAGLGVGGLAIALAAQGTLENFIGGIILYADQPVKVGDFCRFGDRLGAVEDVGLRSVKIRTLGSTVVTVPNADFAKLHLENLTDRDRTLLHETVRLGYETTRTQLRQVLSDLERMLRDHPRIADEPMRVRFTRFGQYFLEIELFAYASTNVWSEFLEIKEGVLLDVIGIVERAGTRLALPTEVHYAGERGALETQERPGGDAT